MLNFDITKDPPTQAEIYQEKRKLNKFLQAAITAMFALCISLITFFLTIYIRGYIDIQLLEVVIVVHFTFFIIFIVADYASDRLIFLYPISPSNRNAAIDCCNDYPEIAAYRNKVVVLGRELTEGEFKAMEEWSEIIEKRKKETEL